MMRHGRALRIMVCVCAAAGLRAQVPVRWIAETSRPVPQSVGVWQGETLAFEPTFTAYGEPLAFGADTEVRLYWQTNGMASAWWSVPGETSAVPGRVRAVWGPTNDAGAAAYSFFLGVGGGGGRMYRASGTMRVNASPGFNPASLPPPSAYPTLAAELAPLVAPLLPGGLATTGDVAAVSNALAGALQAETQSRASADGTNAAAISEHVSRTDNPHAVTPAQIGAATPSAVTGIVSAALAALPPPADPTRLVSADSNSWVTVDGGTATLWRVENVLVSLCDIEFLGAQMDPFRPPFFPVPLVAQFPFYATAFEVEVDPDDWMRGYYLPDGRAEITSSFGEEYDIAATWRSASVEFPQTLYPVDGTTAEGLAVITPTGQFVSVFATNATRYALADFATTQQVGAVAAQIPDVSGLASTQQVAEVAGLIPDVSGLLSMQTADERYPLRNNMPSNSVTGWLVYDQGSNDWLRVVVSNRSFTVWEVQ